MKAPSRPKKVSTKGIQLTPLTLNKRASGKNQFITTSKTLKSIVGEIAGKVPTLIKPYLKLTAAKTIVPDKGLIRAINCSHIFPENPNIEFLTGSNGKSGTLQLEMVNLNYGDGFAISFGVSTGFPGQWKISSNEAPNTFINISPINQSVDILIPEIKNKIGTLLINLEPEFTYTASSWSFNEVTVRKLSF